MVAEIALAFIVGFCVVLLFAAVYGVLAGKIPKDYYDPDEYINSEKAHMITDFRRLRQLSELERADRISRVDRDKNDR